MNKLLASSNTEDGILECICDYWFSPKGAYFLRNGVLFSESKQAPVEGYKVVVKKNRYRFESVFARKRR